MRTAVCVVAAVLLASPARASSTLRPLPIALEHVVHRADLIVQGRVLRILDVHGVHVAEVRVERRWKGRAAGSLYVVTQPPPEGGCAMPHVARGERALLLLQRAPLFFWGAAESLQSAVRRRTGGQEPFFVANGCQGMLPLVGDGTSVRMEAPRLVLPDSLLELADRTENGRATVPTKAVTTWMAARLRSGPCPADPCGLCEPAGPGSCTASSSPRWKYDVRAIPSPFGTHLLPTEKASRP